jgi:ATP-dependent helicase/nuclease subunit A
METIQSTTGPQELVLASAGTGKTFRISSRIVGLLAAGSQPDAIFASTFTRKAAGEILERVLGRLAAAALDERAASELAQHAALGDSSLPGSSDRWLALLRRVISELHRMNVGTLDAFFVRAATVFADEAGLPVAWQIADKTMLERVQAEAIQAVLREVDARELIELIRGLEAKDAARSVYEALLRRADDLIGLHHALDPTASDAWASFDPLARERIEDLDQRQGELATALETAVVPLTTKGEPNSRWVSALSKLADQLRAGAWDQVIAESFFQKALDPDGTYYRKAFPAPIRALAEEVRALARPVIARRLAAQSRATERLARDLAEASEAAQKELGALGFGDITRRLTGSGPLCGRADLYYRLDAHMQHVLLDEFQDTSLLQWNALQPLIDRQLEGTPGAMVVVADPKQSIYGWRGGEPLLVRHVGEYCGLEHDELSQSWRSSQVVLELVNEVFSDLQANSLLADDSVAQDVAEEWVRDFALHTAAKELPGHVRVEAGPYDGGRGDDRPLLCRRAAELVAELRAQAPGCTIGVLTRKNKTVARMMLELRDLGVRASEEGGNPLTDSAAVAAVLSLLRLADHPGDRVARYHVAETPVGEIVDLRDYDDDAAARRVAHVLRRRLLDDGYGGTLEEIARQLGGECSARDRRRLAQLAEMGYRYDSRATLRTTDFVRLVETERVEDPTTADIRVMTVHQSKGLEFDIVVLPELDLSLSGGGGDPLVYRPHPAAGVTRAFPYVSEATRALFPELQELHAAADQAAAARWRDAFSNLYVALTRAKHAVHILVAPDVDGDGKPKQSTARSAARLVRLALGAEEADRIGKVLYERGYPRWFENRSDPATDPSSSTSGERAAIQSVVLRPSAGRGKGLVSVSPSSQAGGSKVDLGSMLALDRPAAERGTLAHAWFERIGWIEDGVPTDDELSAVAAEVAPGMSPDAIEDLRTRFHEWLAQPDIHAVLSRTSYPGGTTVECEVPFLDRRDGQLVEGIIDRLVLIREDARVTRAEVLDYKTDRLQSGQSARLAGKVNHYAAQLDAYRSAVIGWYGMEPDDVRTRLVFLDGAHIVDV